MVTTTDLEQPMLSYYVIYFEKLKKVMQQIENESLSIDHTYYTITAFCVVYC